MSETEAEERAQFTLNMRARGINDLRLLRALEARPALCSCRPIRRHFGARPRAADRLRTDFAAALHRRRDDRALNLKSSHRVCEIGTGTGYCAALLAQLASAIVSLERFQTLAVEASARIKAFGLSNVAALWSDGFEFHCSGERFDRVIVHGLIEPPAEAFRALIAPGGVLVAAVAGADQGEQRIVRLVSNQDGAVEAEDLGPARWMRRLEHGLSLRAL